MRASRTEFLDYKVDIYITVDTQNYFNTIYTHMPYAWNSKWNRWYGIRTPNHFSSPCCKSNQSL